MIISIIILLIQNVVAEPLSEPASDQNVRTVITSDTIECFAKDNVCHAIGNAKAVRTKGKQVSTLTAYKLSAYFKSSQSKNKKATDKDQNIDKLEADDHVKLVFDDKIVKADHGIYFKDEEKIHMYGNVSATEKNSKQGRHLQGEYAVIYVKSGNYQVFPNAPGAKPKGQVKILILEESKPNAKK